MYISIPGYTLLDDCSIQEGVPPELTAFADSAYCDILQKPCRKVYLDGNGIIDIVDLKCKISHIQVSSPIIFDKFSDRQGILWTTGSVVIMVIAGSPL